MKTMQLGTKISAQNVNVKVREEEKGKIKARLICFQTAKFIVCLNIVNQRPAQLDLRF